ncbi:hypothetical protein T05_15811 [Trichinella murrelli]|uniref:Uncharacterized protein n=1 Tax=Trichinella murrelli TaxID=144512 RepID=A0A0V0SQP8_9BILA|nr:hypothetical protein T05_15811 [Trichinella murrelli]
MGINFALSNSLHAIRILLRVDSVLTFFFIVHICKNVQY